MDKFWYPSFIGHSWRPCFALADEAIPRMPKVHQKKIQLQAKSSTDACRECFWHIKGHWRCLLKCMDCHLSNVPNVVASYIVLHNMCKMFGDHCYHEWIHHEEPSGMQVTNCRCNCTCAGASVIRSAIKDFIRMWDMFYVNNAAFSCDWFWPLYLHIFLLHIGPDHSEPYITIATHSCTAVKRSNCNHAGFLAREMSPQMRSIKWHLICQWLLVESLNDRRKTPFDVQLRCLMFPCGISLQAYQLQSITEKTKIILWRTASPFVSQHWKWENLNST